MINTESDLNKIRDLIQRDLTNPLYLKILSKSKMIRSRLALLYSYSFNEQIDDKIYQLCAATEIIHNASLLHDDVMDCAEERRGEASVRKEYSDKLSVMLGDYFVSLAIEKLLKLNNFEILKIYQECIKNMADAEINQYFLRGNLICENEYLEICKKKTGLLFGSLLESIAILINQDSFKARDFGEKFGIYFQLQNDKETFSASEDKKNKIYTLQDIIGIEKENILSDNLKRELFIFSESFPKNILKQGLKDII